MYTNFTNICHSEKELPFHANQSQCYITNTSAKQLVIATEQSTNVIALQVHGMLAAHANTVI